MWCRVVSHMCELGFGSVDGVLTKDTAPGPGKVSDNSRHTKGDVRCDQERGGDQAGQQTTLHHNYLPRGGVYLQQILSYTPSLHTLDLYYCDMNDSDVNKLAESNTCEHINRLRLDTDFIKHEDNIRNLLNTCKKLNVLCLQ